MIVKTPYTKRTVGNPTRGIKSEKKSSGGGATAPAFEFTIDTTIAGSTTNTQFQMPFKDILTYNCHIDWGDGSDDIITAFDQAETLHDYGVSGTYTISVTGTFPGFQTYQVNDNKKITNVSKVGELDIRQARVFDDCRNMTWTATDAPMINTTDFYFMFRNCYLFNGNMSLWDMSGATSLEFMFASCRGLNNNSFENWNTSNVTNFSWMFNGCWDWNGLMTNWDLSNGQDIDGLFNGCSSLNNNSMAGWTFKNTGTYSMATMFSGCGAFNQDLSGWDVSKVTNMDSMFNSCSVLNQDISAWDIQNLTSATNFMQFSNALSTENYDAILIGWEDNVHQSNVTIHFGDAQYDTGATARGNLVSDGWNITDGGEL